MLLIIDGSNLLSAVYYGSLPRYYKENRNRMTEEEKRKEWEKFPRTKKGLYKNGVVTMLRAMELLIKQTNPTHLAVVWDVPGVTFRKEMMPSYKATRKKKDEPLIQQYVTMQKILERMGIAQFSDSEYEADDFAGVLVQKFHSRIPIRLYTEDRDYLQLVKPNDVKLWLVQTPKQIKELYRKYEKEVDKNIPYRTFEYDYLMVKEEFGVWPFQISDLKALSGDYSDNIPGIRGIGDKTATKLLNIFPDIPKLYNYMTNTDAETRKYFFNKKIKMRNPSKILLAESIYDENGNVVKRHGKDAAFFYRKITKIKTDINLPIKLEALELNINQGKNNSVFYEFGLHSLIRR